MKQTDKPKMKQVNLKHNKTCYTTGLVCVSAIILTVFSAPLCQTSYHAGYGQNTCTLAPASHIHTVLSMLLNDIRTYLRIEQIGGSYTSVLMPAHAEARQRIIALMENEDFISMMLRNKISALKFIQDAFSILWRIKNNQSYDDSNTMQQDRVDFLLGGKAAYIGSRRITFNGLIDLSDAFLKADGCISFNEFTPSANGSVLLFDGGTLSKIFQTSALKRMITSPEGDDQLIDWATHVLSITHHQNITVAILVRGETENNPIWAKIAALGIPVNGYNEANIFARALIFQDPAVKASLEKGADLIFVTDTKQAPAIPPEMRRNNAVRHVRVMPAMRTDNTALDMRHLMSVDWNSVDMLTTGAVMSDPKRFLRTLGLEHPTESLVDSLISAA